MNISGLVIAARLLAASSVLISVADAASSLTAAAQRLPDATLVLVTRWQEHYGQPNATALARNDLSPIAAANANATAAARHSPPTTQSNSEKSHILLPLLVPLDPFADTKTLLSSHALVDVAIEVLRETDLRLAGLTGVLVEMTRAMGGYRDSLDEIEAWLHQLETLKECEADRRMRPTGLTAGS